MLLLTHYSTRRRISGAGLMRAALSVLSCGIAVGALILAVRFVRACLSH